MKHIKEYYSSISDIPEIMPGITSNSKNAHGWVNVKIDSDLTLRVSRYTRALDYYSKKTEIEEKLEILEKPDEYDGGIQYKLSVIVLLQYLREIKNNFNSQTSGFLFESYIAGLLHLPKRVEDYDEHVDLHDGRYSYQLKFYDKKSSLKFKQGCDYYILGFKEAGDVVNFWVLDEYHAKKTLTPTGLISFSSIKRKFEPTAKLDLSKIDDQIEDLSNGIRRMIKDLYDNISDLHYNIETIITGVDKNNKVLTNINDIDKYYNKAESNISDMKSDLAKVKGIIKGSVKRKFK